MRPRRTCRDRAVTLVELLIGMVLLSVAIGVMFSLFNMVSRQSRYAYSNLSQMQDALLLLENIRLELQSMVLNPFEDARHHEGNTFVISRPSGTSIQFVSEKRFGNDRKRYLMCYEARQVTSSAGTKNLVLRRIVWNFNQQSPWYARAEYPSNPWLSDWIGSVVETEEAKFRGLHIQDLRWRYVAPLENEGRVFFRVKMVLKSVDGGRFLPFTTLVGVTTPDLPTRIASCPCLFASCFKPAAPACGCCLNGGQ